MADQKFTKAKAVVSACGVVVTALTAALADDVFNLSDVSALISAVVPAVVTVYAVWKVPNKPIAYQED